MANWVFNLLQVRSCVAEYLYTITDMETVKYEDWSATPKELKAKVDGLRSALETPVST